MHSIYHFFAKLVENETALAEVAELEKFAFPNEMLSVGNRKEEDKKSGKFPDLAIKLNRDREIFDGGELIELKDSQGYAIASFNSTIPTGEKNISDIIAGRSGKLSGRNKKNLIYDQMLKAGDDVESVARRQVFYLVRGRKKNTGHTKICLMHGSFFQTLSTEDLIAGAFEQALKDALATSDTVSSDELKKLAVLFKKQETFSRTRKVKNASVTLRFRVMTGAAPEANILNTERYPEIADNTFNFIAPADDESQQAEQADRLQIAFEQVKRVDLFQQLRFKEIKHPYNGKFLVAQIALS